MLWFWLNDCQDFIFAEFSFHGERGGVCDTSETEQFFLYLLKPLMLVYLSCTPS